MASNDLQLTGIVSQPSANEDVRIEEDEEVLSLLIVFLVCKF
jgi:hypothetical protein